MRLQQLSIQCILLHTIFTFAVELNFNDVSKCALSCLVQTFAVANCSLVDTSCQCNNQELVYSTSTCLLQKCPLADSVALGQIRDKICHRKPESRQRALLIVNISLGTLSTVVVALRLLSRCLISKNLWLDDYLILMAMAVNVPSIGTGVWMQLHGLGKHTWYISVANIPIILRLFYASESLYLMTLTITKMSILLFYLRIFPRRDFRITTCFVLGFVALSGIVILFLQIFQCTPVAYNWDRSIKGGKCLNVNVLSYSHAGMTILQDFAILLLPIPELVLLKMERNKKVGIILVFQIGLFACITSIIRLKALTQFDGTKTIDPTWDNVDATIWTSAEINTAILCSSLPALRPLLKALFPRALRSLQNSRLHFERLKTSVAARSSIVTTTRKPAFVQEEMSVFVGRKTERELQLNKPLPLTPAPSISDNESQRHPLDSDSKSDIIDRTSCFSNKTI